VIELTEEMSAGPVLVDVLAKVMERIVEPRRAFRGV
jgi:hypothetical protein